jgi:hypothetical protein
MKVGPKTPSHHVTALTAPAKAGKKQMPPQELVNLRNKVTQLVKRISPATHRIEKTVHKEAKLAASQTTKIAAKTLIPSKQKRKGS